MPASKMSLSQVLSHNVRRLRRLKEWSQDDLSYRVGAGGGPSWSLQIIGQIEKGSRRVTVEELFSLALAFSVPPHVLLYPPKDSIVTIGNQEIRGAELALWLHQPDRSWLSKDSIETEKRAWAESAGVLERLPDEIAERYGAAPKEEEE